jgi:hypothetical protein
MRILQSKVPLKSEMLSTIWILFRPQMILTLKIWDVRQSQHVSWLHHKGSCPYWSPHGHMSQLTILAHSTVFAPNRTTKKGNLSFRKERGNFDLLSRSFPFPLPKFGKLYMSMRINLKLTRGRSHWLIKIKCVLAAEDWVLILPQKNKDWLLRN